MELPEEDMPPQRIWHHNDLLKEWFEAVSQRRKLGPDEYEQVPEAPEGMTVNEAAAGLR